MRFVYDDGGRKKAGYKGSTNDCACRAIAIVTGHSYESVYKTINEFGQKERITKRKRDKSSARTGIYKNTMHKIMEHYGYEWIPTMFIGQGCKVHLKAAELPNGNILVALSRHYSSVIDGVLYDTYDCSREETRCVYGYYKVKEK